MTSKGEGKKECGRHEKTCVHTKLVSYERSPCNQPGKRTNHKKWWYARFLIFAIPSTSSSSPEAEPFDRACGRWAATLERDFLIGEAASKVNKALSCGFTGMVMLEGFLARSAQHTYGGRQWAPKLLANFHPTYYGMMVSTFFPPE